MAGFVDEAARQRSRAMAAAVAQGGGMAVCAFPDHDLLAQQGEWLGACVECMQGHQRVPEAAQDGLAGDKHGRFLGVLL
jgi:hypothetical protein